VVVAVDSQSTEAMREPAHVFMRTGAVRYGEPRTLPHARYRGVADSLRPRAAEWTEPSPPWTIEVTSPESTQKMFRGVLHEQVCTGPAQPINGPRPE
jgi:hypothetical protein